MTASLLAELLKLRRRPAVWVVGGVLLAAVLLFGYAFTYLVFGLMGDELGQVGMDGAEVIGTLLPANAPATAVGYAGSFGGPAALVLGVLVAGSEYSWRTVRTIVTQRPGHAAVLAGKIAAVVALAALATLGLLAVALAGSTAVAGLEGVLGDRWPAAGDLAVAACATWLLFTVWALLGVLLGVLLRGTGLAIGLGLIYALVLEGIVAAVPLDNPAIDVLRQVLLATNGAALANHLGRTFDDVIAMGPAPIEAGQAVLVLLAYTVAFAAAAVAVFARREIA